MSKHIIQHSFSTDGDDAMVQFELDTGKIIRLVMKFRGGEVVDLTPAELVELAATFNQSAEWVMEIGMNYNLETAETPDNTTNPA